MSNRLVSNTPPPPPPVCGGDFSGSSGVITSPGYPHGYSHRRYCQWTIQAPVGKRITLSFDDIDLGTYPNRGGMRWGRRRRGRRCRDFVGVSRDLMEGVTGPVTLLKGGGKEVKVYILITKNYIYFSFKISLSENKFKWECIF